MRPLAGVFLGRVGRFDADVFCFGTPGDQFSVAVPPFALGRIGYIQAVRGFCASFSLFAAAIGCFCVVFPSLIVAVNCFGKTVSLLGVAFRRFTAVFCHFCVAGFRFSVAFFDFAVPFFSFRRPLLRWSWPTVVSTGPLLDLLIGGSGSAGRLTSSIRREVAFTGLGLDASCR